MQGKNKMTNTEKELLENAPVKEEVASNEFGTQVYTETKTAKGALRVSMKTKVRTAVTEDILGTKESPIETLDLSDFDRVNDKAFQKLIGTCPTTGRPVYAILELTVSHLGVADRAKKTSTKASEKVALPKSRI